MSAIQSNTSNQQEPYTKHRKNTIGSWFSKKFGSKRNGDANPTPAEAIKAANGPKQNRGNPPTSNAKPGEALPAFAGDSGQGLASTLTVPRDAPPASTPPPQLANLPLQEPLGNMDFGRRTASNPSQAAPLSVDAAQANAFASSDDAETPHASHHAQGLAGSNGQTNDHLVAAPAISSAYQNDSNDQDRRHSSSSDSSSRDSIGNRTMDTGKSRASTKPTTLMSLETRDPNVLPAAHIAQARHGDAPSSPAFNPTSSNSVREASGTSAVQFAATPNARYSGLPGQGQAVEDTGPFVNVPSHSRPHPANNPQPFGVPPDNASVLTLASSSAAQSLGGAASSRGYNHAPSFGGARSIGGSLMGDRRNSSDTYASLKALPPLSRRGSDSSSRTRESVAASATGQNSAQAMYAPTAGPGAPSDRISIHRTPSQRTVATQLSIPLSASASNAALHAYSQQKPESINGVNGVTSEPQTSDEKPSEALLEAQAHNLAATEHDDTLKRAESADVDNDDKLHVPGGPVISPGLPI